MIQFHPLLLINIIINNIYYNIYSYLQSIPIAIQSNPRSLFNQCSHFHNLSNYYIINQFKYFIFYLFLFSLLRFVRK